MLEEWNSAGMLRTHELGTDKETLPILPTYSSTIMLKGQ
jgi:hypothetical protein